jgi:hypothetical protein
MQEKASQVLAFFMPADQRTWQAGMPIALLEVA